MTSIPRLRLVVLLAVWPVLAAAADAPPCECPPPPVPDWQGSLGAGLSLTGGNSDTNSYSLDFKLKYDPRRKGIFRADGLYLRSDTRGIASVDRTSAGARYEYAVGGGNRWFGFGETRYLRDRFKDVDYLISPTVGVGVRLVDSERVKLGVDTGVGLALEKLRGLESTTDKALNAGQNFFVRLGPSAAFVQTSRAIWKMDAFDDAYYHFDAGILAAISGRLELKLGFADDHKTRPPVGKKKNDTSVLATLVFRI